MKDEIHSRQPQVTKKEEVVQKKTEFLEEKKDTSGALLDLLGEIRNDKFDIFKDVSRKKGESIESAKDEANGADNREKKSKDVGDEEGEDNDEDNGEEDGDESEDNGEGNCKSKDEG